MIGFNPHWGGLDYIQDTPPGDSFSIVFLPSLANDAAAGALQLGSEEGSRQFMDSQFRSVAENMYDKGLIASVMA